MKKLILILSFASIAVACKKNESKSEKVQGIVSDQAAVETNCNIFDTLKNMKPSEQVVWLQGKQELICTEPFDNCRDAFHKISEKDFDDAATAYWGSKTPVFTEIKIGDIERMTPETKYGKFISSSKNDSDEVVLSVTNNFTETPSCYSLPLFYSLGRIHNLNADSLLRFTFGKIKNMDVAIFSIKGESDYYDVSHCPL